MKNTFFFLLTSLLLLFNSFLQADNSTVFNSEINISKSIIVAFDASSIGSTRGEINVTITRNNQTNRCVPYEECFQKMETKKKKKS